MTTDTTRRSIARRLATGALLALALHWPGASRAAGCSIDRLELPVKIVGTRAIATVGINGASVPLLVDSGAFFSFLTEAAAQQLKLRTRPLPASIQPQGLTGGIDARLTTVDHLQLVSGELKAMDFIVGGNDDVSGAMGLLGSNILGSADAEYDLAHGMIRLIVPSADCAHANMAYWAGDTPVSMLDLIKDDRFRNPAIRATAKLDGHDVVALFDTGATTAVSLHAARSAGVKDAAMTPTERMSGAGHGEVDAWTAPFDNVSLGNETVSHNRLQVGAFDKDDFDMLVGIDFFLSHRIYVSRQQSRMFFTYGGGPVFALNKGAPPAAAASGVPADDLAADELARRGAVSLARNDAAAALVDLDRACTLQPGNASFFVTRAHAHQALKQDDAALADFDTALRLDPAQADARIWRAVVHRNRNERDAVLADLSVLDASLPAQSNIRRNMALLYDSLDMPTQAITQWTHWIAAHRHDALLAEASNGRCWARAELGIELDKAMDDCDEAVDADRRNAAYLDSRAWVFVRIGHWHRAELEFDRAIAAKPDLAPSLYGRALVHQHLDEPAMADADLAAARKASPSIDADIARFGLPTVKQ